MNDFFRAPVFISSVFGLAAFLIFALTLGSGNFYIFEILGPTSISRDNCNDVAYSLVGTFYIVYGWLAYVLMIVTTAANIYTAFHDRKFLSITLFVSVLALTPFAAILMPNVLLFGRTSVAEICQSVELSYFHTVIQFTAFLSGLTVLLCVWRFVFVVRRNMRD